MSSRVKRNRYFRPQEKGKVKRKRDHTLPARVALFLIPRMLILAAFGGILYFVWGIVQDDEVFKINEIEVLGCEYTNPEIVHNQLKGILKANIFDIDIEYINRLVKTNSWVREVTTVRRLPDGLKVYVLEHSPVAIAQVAANFYLVSHDGQLLNLNNSAKAISNLPVINLQKETDNGTIRKKVEIASALLLRIRDYKTDIFNIISEVLVNDKYEIALMLTNDNNLLLVNEEDNGKTIMKYLGLLNEIKRDSSRSRLIDLRFRNQVVVKEQIGEF